MWWLKFTICIFVDLFDFTIGRLLFAIPLAGEFIGFSVALALFGKPAFFYLFEILDPTEQLDGFVPTATLIALACRHNEQEA